MSFTIVNTTTHSNPSFWGGSYTSTDVHTDTYTNPYILPILIAPHVFFATTLTYYGVRKSMGLCRRLGSGMAQKLSNWCRRTPVPDQITVMELPVMTVFSPEPDLPLLASYQDPILNESDSDSSEDNDDNSSVSSMSSRSTETRSVSESSESTQSTEFEQETEPNMVGSSPILNIYN